MKMLIVQDEEQEKKSQAGQASEVEKLLEKLSEFRNAMQPWNLLREGSGYGVPIVGDVLTREERGRTAKEFNATLSKLKSISQDLEPEGEGEQALVRENLEIFRKGMLEEISKRY
jgi:hypothetical protein